MLHPEFLAHGDGARVFVLHHCPEGPARGRVLLLPPFAEELNKARRMLALQAAAWARDGWLVSLPDLRGSGDSDGELDAVDVEAWQADLLLTVDARPPVDVADGAPLVLWSLRGGALLAPALQARLDADGRGAALWLAWHPVCAGRQWLRQFLRLRVAAEQLRGGGNGLKDLQARLAAGETVDIAGYPLGSALGRDLGAAGLADDSALPPCVTWYDLGDSLQGPAAALHDAWAARGVTVKASAVSGATFWSTQEIAEVPGLLDRSGAALDGLAA